MEIPVTSLLLELDSTTLNSACESPSLLEKLATRVVGSEEFGPIQEAVPRQGNEAGGLAVEALTPCVPTGHEDASPRTRTTPYLDLQDGPRDAHEASPEAAPAVRGTAFKPSQIRCSDPVGPSISRQSAPTLHAAATQARGNDVGVQPGMGAPETHLTSASGTAHPHETPTLQATLACPLNAPHKPALPRPAGTMPLCPSERQDGRF